MAAIERAERRAAQEALIVARAAQAPSAGFQRLLRELDADGAPR